MVTYVTMDAVSDQSLEVGARLSRVADLQGGGSVLDVWEIRHSISHGDSAEWGRRHSCDVAVELREVEEEEEEEEERAMKGADSPPD